MFSGSIVYKTLPTRLFNCNSKITRAVSTLQYNKINTRDLKTTKKLIM